MWERGRRCAHPQRGDRGGVEIGQKPPPAAQPVELAVVKDDRHAIGRQMYVAFDGIVSGGCRLEGRQRVFPTRLVEVVKAAMRDRAPSEPGKIGHVFVRQLRVSMMASTSTGAFSGSIATPTAERACRPRSPSASASRSEAPLATRCCSAKPGADATKTVIFTVRLNLFEFAQCCLDRGQHVDGADARGSLAGRRVEVAAEKPGCHELALLQRQLSRRHQEVAALHEGQIIGCRGPRLRVIRYPFAGGAVRCSRP